MSMKTISNAVKGLVLSMSVALFMFAASNSFAKKHKTIEPSNEIHSISLPNYYNVCFEKVGGELLRNGAIVCKLPNEDYNLYKGENKNNLLAFMDDNNNVYIGLLWESEFTGIGFVLWKKDLLSNHDFERVVNKPASSFFGYNMTLTKTTENGNLSKVELVGKESSSEKLQRAGNSTVLWEVKGTPDNDGVLHITNWYLKK